jgi:hypothetical protein
MELNYDKYQSENKTTSPVSKKILATLFICLPAFASADFLNPLDFDKSAVHKKQVREYNKKRVYYNLCISNSKCDKASLHDQETIENYMFGLAIAAKNTKKLQKSINIACSGDYGDFCNYSLIYSMYVGSIE